MEARVAAIRAGEAEELVWLVEHPPTYTAGTSATPEGLVDPRFPVFRAGRGGQWTYHGPGQRTAYVMLDLTPAGQGRARLCPRSGRVAHPRARPLQPPGRAARGPRRHLGGRPGARHGGQDRRHRRAGDALGDVARGGAECRPRPRPFRRHRALRHFGARRDQPAPSRHPRRPWRRRTRRCGRRGTRCSDSATPRYAVGGGASPRCLRHSARKGESSIPIAAAKAAMSAW